MPVGLRGLTHQLTDLIDREAVEAPWSTQFALDHSYRMAVLSPGRGSEAQRCASQEVQCATCSSMEDVDVDKGSSKYDLLDHLGGIERYLLKWVCWMSGEESPGVENFFLPQVRSVS